MKKLSLVCILISCILIIVFVRNEFYTNKNEHTYESFETAIETLEDHKYPSFNSTNELVYTVVDILDGKLVISDNISTTRNIKLRKKVNSEFFILLHENSTIAYNWFLNDLTSSNIQLLNNVKIEVPYKGNRDGESFSRRLFHFKVLQNGHYELEFEYQYYDNIRDDNNTDDIIFDLYVEDV